MERRVAIVGEIRVLHALGVVFDDAFEEGEVSEVDGSADADGDVNPFPWVFFLSWRGCLGWPDSHGFCYGECVSWARTSL